MTEKMINTAENINAATEKLRRHAGFGHGANKQVVDFVAAFRAAGLNLGAVDRIVSEQIVPGQIVSGQKEM